MAYSKLLCQPLRPHLRFLHFSSHSSFSFPEKKYSIIVLHCKTSNKRYPNKIEAGLKKQMTAIARKSIV